MTKYKRLTKLTSINFRNKSTFIHCFSHLRRPFDHFVLPTFLRKMPLLEKFNSLAQVLWMKWRSWKKLLIFMSCPPVVYEMLSTVSICGQFVIRVFFKFTKGSKQEMQTVRGLMIWVLGFPFSSTLIFFYPWVCENTQMRKLSCLINSFWNKGVYLNWATIKKCLSVAL